MKKTKEKEFLKLAYVKLSNIFETLTEIKNIIKPPQSFNLNVNNINSNSNNSQNLVNNNSDLKIITHTEIVTSFDVDFEDVNCKEYNFMIMDVLLVYFKPDDIFYAKEHITKENSNYKISSNSLINNLNSSTNSIINRN